MFNTDLPSRAELPSSRQLIVSTLGAIGVAAVILVTTILPAEYGIDPTGAGRVLGLTEMGEIKVSLEQEAAQEPVEAVSVVAIAQPAPVDSKPEIKPEPKPEKQPEPVIKGKQDQVSITLANGQAAELKLVMDKDAKVVYQWTTQGGNLNFDTHGDKKGVSYFGYNKGKNVPGDNGELIAAFTGYHGWFWRNRSGGSVTLTLNVEGDYKDIKRVK
ncbi:transmembrane anchor protein [Endozoicomonadaceae bacterium StTr2]